MVMLHWAVSDAVDVVVEVPFGGRIRGRCDLCDVASC